MQNDLSSAYLLHSRPYRETSVLADFFTLEEGRVTTVARGIRRARSILRGLLQPFTPLWVAWTGKHELMTLKTAEARGAVHQLVGNNLWNGLYLNELLMRLLQRFDPHPKLYQIYVSTIQELQHTAHPEPSLRRFELTLLRELGYGLQFDHETSGTIIRPEGLYQFKPEIGFTAVLPQESHRFHPRNLFAGIHLLAMQQEDFSDSEGLRQAKRLLRQALTHLLGDKPLMSRQLFMPINPGKEALSSSAEER